MSSCFLIERELYGLVLLPYVSISHKVYMEGFVWRNYSLDKKRLADDFNSQISHATNPVNVSLDTLLVPNDFSAHRVCEEASKNVYYTSLVSVEDDEFEESFFKDEVERLTHVLVKAKVSYDFSKTSEEDVKKNLTKLGFSIA